MYDLERLRQDIDLRKILPQILGSNEIRHAGSTMYCKCVSGLHSETKLEHCAVSEQFCHCFSCGETYDAFTYIKKYYEDQGVSLNFTQVCEKIGDCLGGAYLYEEDKTRKQKTVTLPLTNEELKTIGISASSKNGAPNLTNLYLDNPKQVKDLLRKRAKEEMYRYKTLSEEIKDESLKDEYRTLYKKCREVYTKLGGEPPKNVTLFDNI